MSEQTGMYLVGVCGKGDSYFLSVAVETDCYKFVLQPDRACFLSADGAFEFLKKKVSEFRENIVACGGKLISSDYERDSDDFPMWVCRASEV